MKKFEELTQQELKEMYEKLTKIEPKCSIWKPKYGERYWHVTSTGFPEITKNDNHSIDIYNIAIGNYAKTEEEMQLKRDRLVAKQELKNRCHIPTYKDWCDTKITKYYIWYSFIYHTLNVAYCSSSINQGQVCSLNEQDLTDYIKEKGEDFVKKYILDIDD